MPYCAERWHTLTFCARLGSLGSGVFLFSVGYSGGNKTEDDADATGDGHPHGGVPSEEGDKKSGDDTGYGSSDHADGHVGEFLVGGAGWAFVVGTV